MGNHQDRNLLPSDKIARHRELTAHARARYRCFLPDLAGLARVRRVRPMPDLNHSSIEKLVLGVAPASRRLSRGRLAVAAATRPTPPPTICDFRCKKRSPNPSLLFTIVEQ